jgi:hypothetical protein
MGAWLETDKALYRSAAHVLRLLEIRNVSCQTTTLITRSWPWWWCHFNGVGRITWTVTLEPKTPFDLGYTWNYYWR